MATSGNKSGGHKTGGRKKGTPNKRTVALFGDAMEVLKNIGFNPLQRLAEIAQKEDTPTDVQVRACAELAQYLYPKRKAVEIRDGNDQPAKVEYGWVPRKREAEIESSAESNTIHSQVSSGFTN